MTTEPEIRSYARTITETDLVNFTCFAGLTLPIFIDAEFAKATQHGGRIVPGFLTASIVGGMMQPLMSERTIGNLGFDAFRFHVAVKPGDTIHTRLRVGDRRPTSDGERQVVTLLVAAYNQRDEMVLSFESRILERME